MRFQIPQFIDVEDKIVGPFTLKQFIYLAGAVSISVVAVLFLGTFFGLLISAPIIVLSLALAFYRINNRPFVYTLESAFRYLTKDKLYIWKKEEPEEKEAAQDKKFSSLVVPHLSESKLKDMNWELDVKKKGDERINRLSGGK